MAHEMAHVIARHAAIREDQARQAELVSRVATDLLADPQRGALALAKSKIALVNFSRAQEFEADGVGVGISARAGYDPYGAERFLNAMGQNARLRAQNANIDPRAPDFLSSHPATPERVSNAIANARQFSGPGAGERDKAEYVAARRHGLWRGPQRRFRAGPALPAPQARLHLHGPRGLHPRQHRASGVRRQGRRRASAAPRCGARADRTDRCLLIWCRAGSRTSTPRASRPSPSAAFRPQPRPPAATNGPSGSMRCASAAKCIA